MTKMLDSDKKNLYQSTIRVLNAIRDDMIAQGDKSWFFEWEEGEVELRIVR